MEEIINNIILTLCMSYFGIHHYSLNDNQAESNNNYYRQISKVLKPVLLHQKVHLVMILWSNAICQWLKTLEEKCELKTVLIQAMSTKNTLQNYSEYNPNELLFGFNIGTPLILIDQLPTLEPRTINDMVRINLNVFHTARMCFIKAETRERTRSVSRSPGRTLVLSLVIRFIIKRKL